MSTTTPPSNTSAYTSVPIVNTAPSPRKLELILNPDDGSLQTAPLLNVILATTDSLHQDLYNMAHGDIHVASTQQANDNEDDQDGNNNNNSPEQQPSGKTEKMSNLSFAQRRHELAWRLASHSKAIQHVSALSNAASLQDLGKSTAIATAALQHARTAWVQADEAQDALYFFHAQLFPSRQAPHDIYGALDTLLLKYWPDMPSDLKLQVDRYDASVEKQWSSQEVAERWQMAVRSKLLLGEVGWMKKQQQPQTMNLLPSLLSQVPWRISLRGGVVRLMH
ncbi:MAG: hypothetical protein SGILL_008121, partial [Bacillariaceae sp.]